MNTKHFITHDKKFYHSLITLGIPLLLQNLITFAVSFADNLMVGSLGDSAISGVYMGNQVQTLLQLFSGGIEGAILILSAQYWGKKDSRSIKRIISIGIHFSLAFGLLLMILCWLFPTNVINIFTNDISVISEGTKYLRIVCLSYGFFCLSQSLIAAMRSVETARIGMVISAISLVINVTLNYVLIFGRFGFRAMWIRGTAIATLISRIAEAAFMLIYVLRIDTKLRLKISDFLESDRILRFDFLRYGLPIVGGQIIWCINTMSNSMIMGRFDQYVISALSITNTLNTLAYVTINGMTAAIGIIIGKTIGEGRIDLIKEYSRTTQIIFLTIGLFTGLSIISLANPYISLYTGIDIRTKVFAHQFCSVLSVTLVGTCYQASCLAGLVKSGGDISFVFKNDTIFVLGVVLPAALIASRSGAPAWIVFACLKCDQILKCVVAYLKINSYNWIKDLTH